MSGIPWRFDVANLPMNDCALILAHISTGEIAVLRYWAGIDGWFSAYNGNLEYSEGSIRAWCKIELPPSPLPTVEAEEQR